MPPSEADFRRPSNAAALVRAIRSLTDGARPLRIMEICGTHTMAIAQAGLRELLAQAGLAEPKSDLVSIATQAGPEDRSWTIWS